MSERQAGDGNTDAPKVDTDYGERSSTGSEGSGPRRISEVREERESSRGSGAIGSASGSNTHRSTDTDRNTTDRSTDTDRGTSWVSVVLGWLAALGAGLILSGIVSGIVGAILGTGSARQSATEGGTASLIGLLMTLLLAFIIGGYVAGRLASRSGLKHGLLVPLLALLVTIVLAGIGALIGVSFIDQLSGVTLPGLPQDAPQSLGTIATVAGILALLVPFIGGAIGGAWGAKTGRNRP
jgi:hypothetical protein